MAGFKFARRKRLSIPKLILSSACVVVLVFWFYEVRNVLKDDPVDSPAPIRLLEEKKYPLHLYRAKSDDTNVLAPPPEFESHPRNSSAHRSSLDRSRYVEHSFSKKLPYAKFPKPVTRNYPRMKVTPGLGEHGVAVHLSGEEKELAEKEFKSAAFNVYISDRISLNRSVPDPRNPSCKQETYDKDLPTASVVIIFTNEIWSALLRTVYSVIDRSPKHLLREIILVDDFSDKDYLKYHLKSYLQEHFRPNFVKLIRLDERRGLIRARLTGAKAATGDVLIFLDSHCEANINWLEPLLHRIKEKRDAVLCPIIDVIDDKTFEYYANNLDYFQIGGFTWNGHFTWIEIPPWEEKRRKSGISPTRSPTMAGGLFAIDRKYFWEVGSYDPGMDIWGGENLEMSFRVWMCGGTLEIVPCSHVGHIFRSFHPYTFPGNKDTHGINTVRTVEVWMDEYKKYFYFNRPDLKSVDFGNINERLSLKKELKCRPFKWYLENIYPQKFIFHKGVYAYGSVKNPISNLCLDTLGRDEDKNEPLGYFTCKDHPGIVISQLISLTRKGELRIEDYCAEVAEDDKKAHLPVVMATCHGKQRPSSSASAWQTLSFVASTSPSRRPDSSTSAGCMETPCVFFSPS